MANGKPIKFQVVNGFILFGLFVVWAIIKTALKTVGVSNFLVDVVLLGAIFWGYNIIREKRKKGISDATQSPAEVKFKGMKESWHLRLRNAALLAMPLGWWIFFVIEDGRPEEILELLLFVGISELFVWLAYELVVYVVYGAKKPSLGK